MSVDPSTAPYRAAYVRDGETGLYYRIGVGGEMKDEVLVLNVNDPVPPGTPAGTLIVRI